MVKKSNKKDLKLKSHDFKVYLESHLSTQIFDFLEEISKKTEIFIFSGIIRNYFLKYKGSIRDLDLVLSTIDEEILEIIFTHDHRQNSFGGFKLQISSLDIDLWELKNTWAIKNDKVNPELFKELSLPNTAFFNFSSIIYNYNQEEFVYNKNFEEFVDSKELDLVLEENPLPELCIVNTIYYKEKFHLDVAPNLKKYFVNNFDKFIEDDFSAIQIKHFGDIKYSYSFLKTYYRIFSKEITEANNHKQRIIS